MADRKIWILAARPPGSLFGYAAWVLVAVLTVALLWVSLRACSLAGIFPGLHAPYCRADVNVSLSDTDLRREQLSVLQHEIDELEQAITLSPQCRTSVLGDLNCPAEDPKEIAIVLDTSSSMKVCAQLSQSQAEQVQRLYDEAYSAQQAGNISKASTLIQQAQEIERSVPCGEPNRRIDTAMSAIRAFAEQSVPAERVTVTSLGSCANPATDLGVYGPSETDQLVSRLTGVDANIGETPLAATINALVGRIEGGESPDDAVSVILISDGQDGCTNSDPCGAARAFHEAKPHAVINVITVGGDPYVGFCIAEATGGNVYDGRDAANLPRALRQASGDERPDGCR